MNRHGMMGLVLGAATLALTVSACGEEAVAGPGAVTVTLSSSAVGVEPAAHPRGTVTFTVHNHGHHTMHEMYLARTDVPAAALPLTADGAEVDRTELEVLAEIENIAADGDGTITAQVEPGHYVLVCVMEGHGGGWLAADFEVTP